MKKTLSFVLLAAVGAFAVQGCGVATFESKKECFDKKLEPLSQRMMSGDLSAASEMTPQALDRMATECGMSAEEKTRLFSSGNTAMSPQTQVQAATSSRSKDQVLTALPDDGVCRLRYIDSTGGFDSGVYVLSGKQLLHKSGFAYMSSVLAQLKEFVDAAMCKKGVEPVDIVRDSKSEYYVLLGGRALNGSGFGYYTTARALKDTLVEAKIAESKMANECKTVFVDRAGDSGYVVTKDGIEMTGVYGYLSSAKSFVNQLREDGFCPKP